MLKDFREFIARGNVIDLAVGIVIGAAFTAIVNSLVNDIIMPPIGILLGGVDFSAIVITLKEASGEDPAVTMNIGRFVNAVISFLIVSYTVFLLVKAYTRIQKQFEQQKVAEPPAPAAPTTDEKLLAVLERLDSKLDKMA